MDAYKAAKHKIELLKISEDAYRNWLGRAQAGFRAKDRVRAEQDYQALALKGVAGSQEQLIAAKRLIDNPQHLADQERRARAYGDPSDAFQTALTREAEYREDARKAMETWLPQLNAAAQEYKSQYRREYEAWQNGSAGTPPLPKQASSVREALAKVEELYWQTNATLEAAERERLRAERPSPERNQRSK